MKNSNIFTQKQINIIRSIFMVFFYVLIMAKNLILAILRALLVILIGLVAIAIVTPIKAVIEAVQDTEKTIKKYF